MERYGVPDGIDAQEMRKRHEEIFAKFDTLVKDADFQREVQSFAMLSSRIYMRDLERQFTV